jgi:hypothetical protein
MTRYRKKPVEIEAFQFTIATLRMGTTFPGWIELAFREGRITKYSYPTHYLLIQTLEGDMRADLNDWIVLGVKNEIYPVKPDIFEMTHEKVTDDR